MNIYIWEDLSKMSHNYHDGGGLVVIAPSVHAARERLKATPSFPEDSDAFTKEPTYTYAASDNAEERVCAFPDAGCC